MKLWISTLLAVFALALTALAQERQYPAYNFAITPPDGWDAIPNLPPQKGLIAVIANPGKTRLVVLMAVDAKRTDGPLNDQYIADFEKGLTASGGGPMVSGKFIEVQGIKSYERIGTLMKGQKHFTTLTRLIHTSRQDYSQSAMVTDGEASTAPEIQQCLASFRFLTPPTPPMDAAELNGYRVGKMVGFLILPMGVLVLIIFGVIKLGSSAGGKKTARPSATPPPPPPIS